MKFKLNFLAFFIGLALLGFAIPPVSAEVISCESNKEETCFGDAEFSFINRQLPSNLGNYDTVGGYPDLLDAAPQYYYQDKCGMENRTSEGYALFKYMQRDVYLCPFIHISADQWIEYAEARPDQGYVVSDIPVVGSIAVMKMGLSGHAAFVEEVMEDGKIRVSQYDLLPGSYSESTIKAHGVKFLINSPKGMKGA